MTNKLLSVCAIATFAVIGWAQAAQAPMPPMTPPSEAPQKSLRARRIHVEAPSAAGSYLGIDPRDVAPDRVAVLNLNESRGVEVMMVDRDSPAGKGGLKEHDVILGFNGKPVDNADQLRRILRETQPGKTAALSISRAGKPLTLNLTLTKRPEEFAMMPMVPQIPPMPPMDIDVPSIIVLESSSRNGIMVEDLTPQLADFFGVKNGQGVLVRSVDRGSPASSAGLKAGDVIVKVANEPVTCSSDWRRIMHQRHGSVPVAVVRDKREQNVTIKLPEKSSDSSLHIEVPNFGKEMEQLRAEMEKLRPQINKQMEIAKADLQNELQAHQKEIDQALRLHQQDFDRARREAQKALEQALKELNKE